MTLLTTSSSVRQTAHGPRSIFPCPQTAREFDLGSLPSIWTSVNSTGLACRTDSDPCSDDYFGGGDLFHFCLPWLRFPFCLTCSVITTKAAVNLSAIPANPPISQLFRPWATPPHPTPPHPTPPHPTPPHPTPPHPTPPHPTLRRRPESHNGVSRCASRPPSAVQWPELPKEPGDLGAGAQGSWEGHGLWSHLWKRCSFRSMVMQGHAR